MSIKAKHNEIPIFLNILLDIPSTTTILNKICSKYIPKLTSFPVMELYYIECRTTINY